MLDDRQLLAVELQRMFGELALSDMQDCSALGLCENMKDWDGNPVNVALQEDAQQFLLRCVCARVWVVRRQCELRVEINFLRWHSTII